MRAFQPSPGFISFYLQIMLAAESPVVAGTFLVERPIFANPQEQAFTDTMLMPLAAQIHAMKQSVTPAPTPISPQVAAYMAQGMTQYEAIATEQWFSTMSTP